MKVRGRVLVLPAAAAVILALVAYKETRTYPKPRVEPDEAVAMRPALLFELYDQTSRPVRFERYVGRRDIILVFFDGKAGADRDLYLNRLRENFSSIKAMGTVVVAVSEATPYANRRAIEHGGEFPFPLLSDPDFRVHRLWGQFDDVTHEPKTGIFLVDRTGRVAWQKGRPKPMPDLDAALEKVLGRD